ncbi:MAG: hypothetical protein K4571_14835 [Deltaproteobacteria bacterium]
MKTILSIVTAILCLGVLAATVGAGPVILRDPEGAGPGARTAPLVQPRKQLPAPAKPQTPTRTEVRPVLKKTAPFKALPSDDRKKINDDMDP